MNTKRIYLAGGIMNLSFEDAYDWRRSIAYMLKEREANFVCFNPLDHDIMQDEVEYDLNILRHSDLIVVNFNDPKSLGTMAEIAIAYEYRIPIIGYCSTSTDIEELHPWILHMVNEICIDFNDLIDKIINYDI